MLADLRDALRHADRGHGAVGPGSAPGIVDTGAFYSKRLRSVSGAGWPRCRHIETIWPL
jgi:hypothetical protein